MCVHYKRKRARRSVSARPSPPPLPPLSLGFEMGAVSACGAGICCEPHEWTLHAYVVGTSPVIITSCLPRDNFRHGHLSAMIDTSPDGEFHFPRKTIADTSCALVNFSNLFSRDYKSVAEHAGSNAFSRNCLRVETVLFTSPKKQTTLLASDTGRWDDVALAAGSRTLAAATERALVEAVHFISPQCWWCPRDWDRTGGTASANGINCGVRDYYARTQRARRYALARKRLGVETVGFTRARNPSWLGARYFGG